MIFADVLAWFNGSELSLPKLRADFAYGLSLCCVLGKAHNQTVRKLLARLVAVNVGNNHGGPAWTRKVVNGLSRLGLSCLERRLKAAQRPARFIAGLLQTASSPRPGRRFPKGPR